MATDTVSIKAKQAAGWIIAGLVGLALAFLVFRFALYPDIRDRGIAGDANLPIVQARVISFNRATNGNYSITFEWTDNGARRTGVTRAMYFRNTAESISQEGYINIRVSGSGRAVNTDFADLEQSFLDFVIWGGVLIIAAASVFSFAYSGVTLNKMLRLKQLESSGDAGEGAYVRHRTEMAFTGVETVTLDYSYTDKSGAQQTGTARLVGFDKNDMRILAQMKTFPLTHNGRHSKVIPEDIKGAIETYRRANPEITVKTAKPGDIEDIFSEFFAGGSAAAAQPSQLINGICPNCMGKIEFEDRDKGLCKYCGTSFVIK